MIVPSHISTKIYKVFQSTMHFKFGWFWITGNQKSLLWSAQSSMSSDTPATVTFWCWTRFHLIHSLYFHTKYPVLQPLIFIYFLSLLFQHFSYCFLNLYHVPLDILQLIYSFEGTRKKKADRLVILARLLHQICLFYVVLKNIYLYLLVDSLLPSKTVWHSSHALLLYTDMTG